MDFRYEFCWLIIGFKPYVKSRNFIIKEGIESFTWQSSDPFLTKPVWLNVYSGHTGWFFKRTLSVKDAFIWPPFLQSWNHYYDISLKMQKTNFQSYVHTLSWQVIFQILYRSIHYDDLWLTYDLIMAVSQIRSIDLYLGAIMFKFFNWLNTFILNYISKLVFAPICPRINRSRWPIFSHHWMGPSM